jgi:DNA mismatch endonuclease, patch repair protein
MARHSITSPPRDGDWAFNIAPMRHHVPNMADVFTTRRRSAIMRLVRGTGNASTEQRLVRLLRAERITGWRRGSRLVGSPDFAWRRKRLAVFVDGCFWHGCRRHGHTPRSRVGYWASKLARNKSRDRIVTQTLRQKGWRGLRIWEHELTRKNEARLMRRIRRALS